MASDYDWHPDTSGGGSVFKVETQNLGWWIFLAVIVSIGVHIILWVVLSSWEQESKASNPLDFRLQTKQETIDRSELERLLNEESMPENLDVTSPDDLSDIDVDTNMDDFDIIDQIDTEELVRMAPGAMAELGASAPMPQVPFQALDMAANTVDLASAEMLSNDLADMKKQLVSSSSQVAAEQMVLDIDSTNISKGVNTDDFFKDAASKVMGRQADEFVKGYASLDDLIGQAGGIRRGTNQTALLPSDILFGFNQTELKDGAKIAMIKLAYLIETNPDATFIIEGHTDSIGPDEANRILSEKRARSVRDWLVRQLRINPGNIRVAGKGESQPIVEVTGVAEEEALNRRVEIQIIRR